jgi:hypothetical protein
MREVMPTGSCCLKGGPALSPLDSLVEEGWEERGQPSCSREAQPT